MELRIEIVPLDGKDASDTNAVQRVCAHPQALAQCRVWLDDQLPDAQAVAVSASNAEGARRARDERGTAAIAGHAAAEIYGLTLLAHEIEDRSDNTTAHFWWWAESSSAPAAWIAPRYWCRARRYRRFRRAVPRLLEPLAQHRISL